MGSVRDLLSNVEQAYWELYFFYQNLNVAKQGRDNALAAYQKVNALFEEGGDGGEAEKVAQAKEQYFFFRGRMEEAQRDLFRSETRLRFLMGITPTDHRLFVPADKPTAAQIEFDWNDVYQEAMVRSGELMRQAWQIRQSELRLIAAKNQLLPQFDAVALYRWLGNGDNFNSDRIATENDLDGNGIPDFPANAVADLWRGRKQEFRVGMELNIPLGFRQAMSQVNSSQMELARDRARLEDMELELVHQLTDAMQRLDAGHRGVLSQFGRRVAASEQVKATTAAFVAGTVQLDLLLDAQRRLADANLAYYQALVEHNLNLMNLHYRKGSLLEYNGVLLQEGPWPKKAYFDAVNEARRRDASYYLDYGFSRPRVVSRGSAANRWQGGTVPVDPTTSQPVAPLDISAPTEEESDASSEGETLESELQDALDAVTEGPDTFEAPAAPSNPSPPSTDLPSPDATPNTPDGSLPEPPPLRIEPRPDAGNPALEARRRTHDEIQRKKQKRIDIKWK